MDIAEAEESDTEHEMAVISDLFTSDVVITADKGANGLLDGLVTGINASNDTYSDDPLQNMGSTCSIMTSTLSCPLFLPSSPSAFSAIIDSGATVHMFLFCAVFAKYHTTPGGYMILVNKQHIFCIGIGTVVI